MICNYICVRLYIGDCFGGKCWRVYLFHHYRLGFCFISCNPTIVMSANRTERYLPEASTLGFFHCIYSSQMHILILIKAVVIHHYLISHNRNCQLYSKSIAVKSETINLSRRQGSKPAFRQWKLKGNNNIKPIPIQYPRGVCYKLRNYLARHCACLPNRGIYWYGKRLWPFICILVHVQTSTGVVLQDTQA